MRIPKMKGMSKEIYNGVIIASLMFLLGIFTSFLYDQNILTVSNMGMPIETALLLEIFIWLLIYIIGVLMN